MSIPYYPMYPTDFDADTSHLSLSEDGAYNRLLRLCWRTPGCSVPHDLLWIRRRMRATQQEFDEVISPVMDEFFTVKSGRLLSVRLMEEYKKVSETYAKRSAAGKKGGRPKATENKQKDEKVGLSPRKAGPKQPEPEPEPIKKQTKKDDVFDLVWGKYPRKIGKGNAQKAWEKARQKERAEVITAALDKQIAAWGRAGTEKQFIPHLATWLNGGRWSDEIQEEQPRGELSNDQYLAAQGIF